MRPRTAILLAVFALLLVAVACNEGDGQPEATASPADTGTPEATATDTAQATPDATPQPTPTETAPAETAPAGTAPAGTSPAPSDGQARLVVVAADQGAFLTQEGVFLKLCAYDQESGLVDCKDSGLYQLQDGIEGKDAVCRVMLIEDEPVGLNCQTSDPLQVIGYEIQ